MGGLISEVRSVGLPFGDYQAEYLDGVRSTVVFERKSIGDLFGTLSSGMKRFRREIERSKQVGARLVIAVEGTIEEVEQGHEYSTKSGETILKTLGTLMFKHGIPTMFNPSRADMARMITWVFESEGYHRRRQSSDAILDDKIDIKKNKAIH